MPPCGTTRDEKLTTPLLRRGKGRQALGWVVEWGTDPPRRCAPPLRRGDFGELWSNRACLLVRSDDLSLAAPALQLGTSRSHTAACR